MGGEGYGLVQFTPYRKDGYVDYKFLGWAELSDDEADAMAESNPTKLIDLQLEYLIWSCQPTIHHLKRQWWATDGYNSPAKMSYAEYTQSRMSAGDLALVFHASYERSADSDSVREKRARYAGNWYTYFGGI